MIVTIFVQIDCLGVNSCYFIVKCAIHYKFVVLQSISASKIVSSPCGIHISVYAVTHTAS